MPTKDGFKRVEKKWGAEVWLVNAPEYCGKLLYLMQGGESSYHYHPKKKETFYCLQGQVNLIVDDKSYMLNPFAPPKTIENNAKHSFKGITDSIIMEISTHHDDRDVIRLSESKAPE